MGSTIHLNNRISSYGLSLALLDLGDLRARVRRLNVELPWGMLTTMKRHACIRMLLVNEFGAEVIDKYEEQCREWDEMRAFVEYGIDPDKKRLK